MSSHSYDLGQIQAYEQNCQEHDKYFFVLCWCNETEKHCSRFWNYFVWYSRQTLPTCINTFIWANIIGMEWSTLWIIGRRWWPGEAICSNSENIKRPLTIKLYLLTYFFLFISFFHLLLHTISFIDVYYVASCGIWDLILVE